MVVVKWEELEEKARVTEALDKFKDFIKGYRYELRRNSCYIWPVGYDAALLHCVDSEGESRGVRLTWGTASRFADKILQGEIVEVKVSPYHMGIAAASIRKALDWAFHPENNVTYDQQVFLKEAMAAMYLLGLYSNCLVNMINRGLEEKPHLVHTAKNLRDTYKMPI